MYEGEKTWVFWLGLIILALASVGLFSIVWYVAQLSSPYNVTANYYWNALVPPIIGTVVFILIGLYMMKSGVKQTPLPQQ
jgi:hypothetical protein